MKSFALGLALLVAGFTSYVVSTATKNITIVFKNIGDFLQQLAEAGVFPQNVTLPEGLGMLSIGIPQNILNIVPYVSLGVMAFGVGWFWIIEPMLYLAMPPKKQASAPPVTSRAREAEGVTLRGKSLEQWVQEAIQEKIERERGRSKSPGE